MAKSEQKKSAALQALATSNTLTEAAEKAGISRRTLFTYINQDTEFAEAFREMQEERHEALMNDLRQFRVRAFETLASLMEDEEVETAYRIKAACALIQQGELTQNAQRTLATTLLERVEEKNDPFSTAF